MYVSDGMGIDSVALHVLARRGVIAVDAFIFAHVGEDTENPATLAYLDDVMRPYMETHGQTFVEVRKRTKDGQHPSILEYAYTHERSIPLPVYLGSGAPANRKCTVEWKVDPVGSWLYRRGHRKATPAVLALGFAADESQRARVDSGKSWIKLTYPLIELGMTRADCRRLIADEGLPIPPKSACWFCPFQSRTSWVKMREERPEMFARAVALETKLNARRSAWGKDAVTLHASRRMLLDAVGEQAALFPDEPESYSCGPFACASVEQVPVGAPTGKMAVKFQAWKDGRVA